MDLRQSLFIIPATQGKERWYTLFWARYMVSMDGVAEPNTSSAPFCAQRYFATSLA